MRMLLVAMLLLSACGPGEPGPQGPPGPAGPAGPQGPKGDDGLEVVSNALCIATVAINGRSMSLQHRVLDFADGSTFASCSVSQPVGTNSTTAFYDPGTNGAVEGSCLVASDVDSASFGYWSFGLPEGAIDAVAVYTDTASPYNGARYSVPCVF